MAKQQRKASGIPHERWLDFRHRIKKNRNGANLKLRHALRAGGVIGASLSEPHCYVANRGKRNALWCVRTRNFSTVIEIPSACDRNFYQFVVNLPIVFPSSQLLRQFAWLRISQDASHFARRNLLAELVEQ